MHEHYNKSHKNRFEQFAGFKTATILAGLNVYSIKVSLYSFIKQQTLQQQQQQLSINNDEHFVLHPYFFACSRTISVLLLVFFSLHNSEKKRKKILYDIVVNTACIRYIIYGFRFCFVLRKMANMPKSD